MLRDTWRRHCLASLLHGAGIAVIFLALLLGACGSDGTSVITPQSTTPSTASATAVAQGPTPTALPPGVVLLWGTVSEDYITVNCPSGKPSGTICVTARGTGRLSSLGDVSLMRNATLNPGGTDSCGPSTMDGTLTVSSGDTISFTATGTFCRGTGSARYTYTIIRGTGTYLGAGGKGNITVPRPSSSSADVLTWDGTLVAK